ncbi:uncharacterized protein LOC129612054 [Condylostylus longicornis]|uniref:uncharacterized protein LOC129612054 n=1 Tax=Condylostylus longicornis TaxID=2530218 RepID=UPI00244DF1FD|nr:uncharacterized protein LOC129612054 [Condylostylus longicornis]
MESFVIIRNYSEQDELKCQELVRDYVMHFAKKSFYAFCFREITLQFIVITWAILFIFLGVPLTFCSLTVPGCIFFIFIATYCSCYAKAVELMQTKPNQCLVAEAYEPFISRGKISNYRIYINEAPFEQSYKNKFRRKIIGTVSLKNHSALYNAGWIYRFAIDPNYSFHKIAEPMLNLITKNCHENGYSSLEVAISEFQEDERDFYDCMGFETRQIYHKQIIGNNLTLMKSQLSFDLHREVATYSKQS